MSRLSSDRLVVAVHERGINALHVRHGFLPRSPITVLDRQRFDVGPLPTGEEDDSPAWQRPLALLRDLKKVAGISTVHLVLSNHFVRYMLLPWDNIVACGGNTHDLASAQFQLAFGDAAGTWQVNAEAPHFRSSSLAVAVDTQLLAAASELATAAGLKIAGVRPHLLTALRRWRMNNRQQRTRNNSGWFAVYEPGRLTVLGGSRGNGTSLHNLRLHAPEALFPTLQQCVLADRLQTVAAGPVLLQAPGWSGNADWPDFAVRIDAGDRDFGEAMAYGGSA